MHPITNYLLSSMSPKSRVTITDPVSVAMTKIFPDFEITSRLRTAHFLAQACHETDGWSTLDEYGGEEYFLRMYDPKPFPGESDEDARRREARAKSLGNTKAGDGARFHGRGIFQLTGRDNYTVIGKKTGLNLVKEPELASDPAVSVLIACHFWQSRDLNILADESPSNVAAITRKINGGERGLVARQRYFNEVMPNLIGK